MGDPSRTVRVAVVQAAPVFLDREGTTEKAARCIAEAGQKRVDLLAFPEGFIPTHPIWYHFQPAAAKQSLTFATELFKNSVEIPGPTTEVLCAAAARANVNVVMGLCERRPKTTGTLFNSQLFIGRDGRILGKHQKLVPTVGERLVHTGGYGDLLRVFEMDIGRVSGLICGENSNPLAIFSLAAQGTQIHVASWPNRFSQQRMPETITFVTRSFAYMCCSFVLNACSIVDDRTLDLMPLKEEDRKVLSDQETTGGSSIIGANSMILAGPMKGLEEGLLVADINLDDCIRLKMVHDYSGHYNRPDIFSLTVNTAAPEIFKKTKTPGPVPCETDAEMATQVEQNVPDVSSTSSDDK